MNLLAVGEEISFGTMPTANLYHHCPFIVVPKYGHNILEAADTKSNEVFAVRVEERAKYRGNIELKVRTALARGHPRGCVSCYSKPPSEVSLPAAERHTKEHRGTFRAVFDDTAS